MDAETWTLRFLRALCASAVKSDSHNSQATMNNSTPPCYRNASASTRPVALLGGCTFNRRASVGAMSAGVEGCR